MASLSSQPQQFGSVLHEPFLARASEPTADLGRHALGAFLTLRLADRFRPGEEGHPLALAYQVRATRDYLLDLQPKNEEVSHLLEIVRLADGVQQGGARSMLEPPLLAYAFWLEEELRLAEALDVIETALGLHDGSAKTEGIAALLQRARVLRLMGQLDDARATYDAAKTRAASVGDTHSTLLARIGAGIVTRHVGNLPGSEGELRAVLKDAEELGDADARARAHHEIGVALMYQGKNGAAVPHYFQAFELYERPAHKLRALSDVGEALKREGNYAAARDAFSVVLSSKPREEQRVITMIALLELSVHMRDRLGFSRWKHDITAIADELPLEQSADFHLQVGLGCAVFNQRRSAEKSLRVALEIAERHRLNEYAFRAEAALTKLAQKPAPDTAAVSAVPEAEESLECAEIAEKLHALAS